MNLNSYSLSIMVRGYIPQFEFKGKCGRIGRWDGELDPYHPSSEVVNFSEGSHSIYLLDLNKESEKTTKSTMDTKSYREISFSSSPQFNLKIGFEGSRCCLYLKSPELPDEEYYKIENVDEENIQHLLKNNAVKPGGEFEGEFLCAFSNSAEKTCAFLKSTYPEYAGMLKKSMLLTGLTFKKATKKYNPGYTYVAPNREALIYLGQVFMNDYYIQRRILLRSEKGQGGIDLFIKADSYTAPTDGTVEKVENILKSSRKLTSGSFTRMDTQRIFTEFTDEIIAIPVTLRESLYETEKVLDASELNKDLVKDIFETRMIRAIDNYISDDSYEVTDIVTSSMNEMIGCCLILNTTDVPSMLSEVSCKDLFHRCFLDYFLRLCLQLSFEESDKGTKTQTYLSSKIYGLLYKFGYLDVEAASRSSLSMPLFRRDDGFFKTLELISPTDKSTDEFFNKLWDFCQTSKKYEEFMSKKIIYLCKVADTSSIELDYGKVYKDLITPDAYIENKFGCRYFQRKRIQLPYHYRTSSSSPINGLLSSKCVLKYDQTNSSFGRYKYSSGFNMHIQSYIDDKQTSATSLATELADILCDICNEAGEYSTDSVTVSLSNKGTLVSPKTCINYYISDDQLINFAVKKGRLTDTLKETLHKIRIPYFCITIKKGDAIVK